MFTRCGLLNFLIKDTSQFSGVVKLPACGSIIVRTIWRDKNIEKPKAPGVDGAKGYYRRIVHYPKEYTLQPVPTTNLAGRDPKTGRVIVGTLGGGIKWPYLWVDYNRSLPPGSPPLVEKVLDIIVEPNRTAHIALVGSGDRMRYIIATENMKKGDTITTYCELTRNAVRAKEGDAHPLGSLPLGTKVCCVEMNPGRGGYYARAAGTSCTLIRKYEDRVVVMMPTKHEHALNQMCTAVVGRVSNAVHSSIPIGSANRLRWLGYRPRSGLWQRKSGRHGRKIRALPPCREILPELPPEPRRVKLTLDEFPNHLP